MTHQYTVTGMTCIGCQTKVQSILSKVNGVKNVSVNLATNEASVEMDKHIPINQLKAAFNDFPKYSLQEKQESINTQQPFDLDETRSWLIVYKPLLLILVYIVLITVAHAITTGVFDLMGMMNTFMAGVFLSFSFFKLLDLSGFANIYATYDIVAKRFGAWGFIYAFIELFLGIAYATHFQPLITNIVTLVIMSISIIGVLQSVLNKRKIKCACLGVVFNLPMSTVTIIEDSLMIAMSAAMILMLL
jgi:copper chaperone CopZ